MLATIYTKTLRDRTLGMLLGVLAIGLFLLMGMAVYSTIDPSFYYELPAALLDTMGISPELGGVAGIAYGAMYGLIGALTIAGLAVSIGAAGVAGEERDRTLGLLLATPRSRRQVLASKLGALVTLVGLAALLVWAAAELVPVVLDAETGGTATGALSLHLGANALLWGALAACLGAWTGRRGLASAAAGAAMVLAWLLASFLPLIGEFWADLARLVPWYWFNGHAPETAGVSGGYLALQLGVALALMAAAFVGVERRDLRDGERSSALLERLLATAAVRTVSERLSGSVRTSRIAAKTSSDHQGLVAGVAAVLLYVGLLVVPIYTFMPAEFTEVFRDLPDALIAAIGGVDMSTPAGWIQGEHYSLVVPVAMVTALAAMGAGALGGEEEDRTMDLLLSTPVPRWQVVLEKAAAMVAVGVLLGLVTFGGVALGIVIGGLEVSILNAAAISALGTLFGLVVGGVALAASAATGRRQLAVGVAAGVGLVSYVVESFLPLAQDFEPWAQLSPFHYYLGGDPLTRGMPWADAGVLAGLFVALVAVSVALFDRRDVRGG